jgi:succinoglycan biosynthesis protein ExoV
MGSTVKLFYFRSPDGVTNFGDELNRDLWRHFLPRPFDDDASTLFVGVGTLLNDRLPKAKRTIVFGSGVGYGSGLPRRDEGWDVYCVRGPLSARALDLSEDLAITDPAALVSRIPADNPRANRWKYGFMPHWESPVDEWERVSRAAGLGFVDPRWPPDRVLDAIRCTNVLITEAMHGAIVADALRVPWVPVRTSDRIRSFKWEDWCGSMALDYRPQLLPTIWRPLPHAGPMSRARRCAKLTLAARSLKQIAARGRPVLSSTDVLETRVRQLEDRLELLKAKEFGGPRMDLLEDRLERLRIRELSSARRCARVRGTR